jgi:hypothetical protein
VPLTCDVPGIGNLAADVTTGAYGPSFYTPGQVTSLTDVFGTLSFPPASIDALIAAGASSFQLTVTDFELDGSGASPTAINAVSNQPIVEPTLSLSEGQSGYLSIPASGPPLSVGPFTADASGAAEYTFGTTATTLTLYGPSGAEIGSPLSVPCDAPVPAPVVYRINIDTGTNPPTVTKLSAKTGSIGGGSTITITGTNFSGATGVQFGPNAATSVSVGLFGNTITATVPPGTNPGTVNVEVLGPGGTSSDSTADQYTYS